MHTCIAHSSSPSARGILTRSCFSLPTLYSPPSSLRGTGPRWRSKCWSRLLCNHTIALQKHVDKMHETFIIIHLKCIEDLDLKCIEELVLAISACKPVSKQYCNLPGILNGFFFLHFLKHKIYCNITCQCTTATAVNLPGSSKCSTSEVQLSCFKREQHWTPFSHALTPTWKGIAGQHKWILQVTSKCTQLIPTAQKRLRKVSKFKSTQDYVGKLAMDGKLPILILK